MKEVVTVGTAERFPQERLLVQAIRIFCYFLVLILALTMALFQDGFFNWQLLEIFYSTVFVGLGFHALNLFFFNKLYSNQKWLLMSFWFDVILISILTVKSQLSQSLFLFLYLVFIVLSGLVTQKRGALLVALASSVAFSAASILGPDLKTMSMVFLLILNNISFFVVAWLAGYLSDQFINLDQQLRAESLNLQTVRRLNELIVQTIPSGLINTNSEGEILLFNLGASEIFGSSLRPGANVLEFLPELPLDQKNVQQWPRELIRSELSNDLGGIELEKRLRVNRLSQEGAPGREPTLLYVIEDLTEVRRLEEQVRQSEKLAAVGQLAAGIAHEIRNPLAGISGSIELLSQTSTNEDDRKLTKIILREIDRLNNLISEFLDYAKPERRVLDPVDLKLLLAEVLKLAASYEPKNLKLQNELATGPSRVIAGNRDKLKQAFLNIVINGFQALANCEQPKFEIFTKLDEGHITICLKDNGPGMTEAVRARVFEPFMTTKPKGTGLGLAVTHKILEAHSAQIEVESTVGVGTQFTIRFAI